MRVFGLALLVTVGLACSGRAPCGPTTCTGCCDQSGACVAGSSSLECGRSGAACTRCSVTDSCAQGACTPNFTGQGGGAGTGGGSSGGGASGGGSAGCRLQTACVMDVDCAMGSRCNTALAPPACQVLYCGAPASQCSAGYFCASRLCRGSECLDPDAGQPFGTVLSATVDYVNQADGGFTPGLVISFTDDLRNDCAAFDARMEYGSLALLSGLSLQWSSLTNGRVVPWITDAMARMGAGPRPAVAFARDGLSGLRLHEQSGAFTLDQVPTAGSPTLVFSLRSADGGFSGTWRAGPLCP